MTRKCLSLGWVAGLTVSLLGCTLAETLGLIASPAGTTTTIVLVRHAEREAGADPPLNDEGVVRAEALKQALLENGVTAIYCTDLIRNRQTVQPLADALGLELNLVSPALYADTVSTAAQIVDEVLRDHAGGVVLFCGNVGSVIGTPGINESIYKRLGGGEDAPNRYQDLYVFVVPEEGAARIVKSEYGGESSKD